MEIFETITWRQYLIHIAIGLVLYYAIIIILRYRNETHNMLVKRKEKRSSQSDENFTIDDEEDEGLLSHQSEPEQKNIQSFDELEALVTEIRHSILEKAGTAVSKDDLLVQISNRLTDYGGLRQPAYRIALTNFIIEQSENICGVTFSEEELEEAWRKLPR
jgi:hypothetical protein